jgi:hypothetical protein
MNMSNQTTLATINDDQMNEFLKRTGLDMEVQKIASPNVLTGELNSGYYDIYNGTTKAKIHSGVGDSYKVIQYREAFDSVRQIAGLTNISLGKGGTWKGGAEGWGQIDLGTFTVGKKDGERGDRIAKRLTMVTSHNGRFMFDLLFTPLRFWCENQLPALGTLEGIRRTASTQSLLRTRHTGKGILEIENLPEVLTFVNGQFERTEELYNKMADIKIIDRDYITEVLARLFPVKDSERSKTSVKKQITTIMSNYKDADGGRMERDTVWNLFNSIQGSYQHTPIKRTTNHDKSVLLGTIAEKSAVAMQVVMDVCSSQHVNVLDKTDPIAQMLADIEAGKSI